MLLPMLGRAHLVKPLLASLDGSAPVTFVCTPGDNDAIQACLKTGQQVLIADWPADRGDYAKKINWAYRETTEPYLFLGASDLVFWPNWHIYALQVASRTGAGVIGTQDTKNPLVKRAQQSTHSLVRRSYIQQYGGTVDNTGHIYCELYDHQYIDIELVETAKLRGEWAFAKRSVVEHRHPHWGTAENDATYMKATRATLEDRELYVRRIRRAQTVIARQHARAL